MQKMMAVLSGPLPPLDKDKRTEAASRTPQVSFEQALHRGPKVPKRLSVVCVVAAYSIVGSALSPLALAEEEGFDAASVPAPVIPPEKPKPSRKLSPDQQFWAVFAGLTLSEPAKAVTEAQKYMQTGTVSDGFMSKLYRRMIEIRAGSFQDKEGALALSEEALSKIKNPATQLTFHIEKAALLSALGRGKEAESILEKQWPLALEQGSAAGLSKTYVDILNQNQKPEMALEIAREAVVSSIDTPSKSSAVLQLLIEQLLAAGMDEEAVSWSKLYFMLCPYDERSLQSSVQLMMRTWTAKHMSAAKASELVAALQDPAKPNPLQDVKLPELDMATLVKRTAKASVPESHISLLVMQGDYRGAMLQARLLMLNNPQSTEGYLQACRIFKAKDLNMQRANEFLEYYKTGQGENPLTAFLAETEKA